MSEGVVVVTGASGYIGSHVVANLLSKGKTVRATVRDCNDTERVGHLTDLDILEGGSLEIVEMDLFDSESVDAAIFGTTDVIHTAAAVIVRSEDPQSKIVDPSVIGTQNVISAIEKSGSVERFVHTSSTAAIRPENWEDGITLTTETFASDATLEENPYGLAKYSAEMIVREWHENLEGAKKMKMVTIHPCMVFGPPLSSRHLRGSLSVIMMLVNRELPVILPMQINIVDVRDVAEAHVRALTMGADKGRYLTVAGEMMWADISKILKQRYPKRKWPVRQLPYYIALIVCAFHPKVSISWAKRHLKNKLYWDATPAENDLQMKWRSLTETITDTIPNIIDNDWK
jgi:nucleoside-diphosphate-sugar epimerase